jgi:hypothetical protein
MSTSTPSLATSTNRHTTISTRHIDETQLLDAPAVFVAHSSAVVLVNLIQFIIFENAVIADLEQVYGNIHGDRPFPSFH